MGSPTGAPVKYDVRVDPVNGTGWVGIRWLVGEQRIGRRAANTGAANTGATPPAPIGLSA